MAQLQTDIGKEQQKHTALRTKAEHYRRMAVAVQRGTVAQEAFPKYVPRGKPAAWYIDKAEAFEQSSETAGAMAHLLSDMEQRNRWDAMSAEEAWARLVTGSTWMGYRSQGVLEVFAWMVDRQLEEIRALAPKLSPEQRDMAQSIIRALLTGLLREFA